MDEFSFGWKEIAMTASAVLSALALRLWRKTEEEIKGKASKDQIAALLEKMAARDVRENDRERDAKEFRKTLTAKLDKNTRATSQTAERVAHIEGRLLKPNDRLKPSFDSELDD